MAIWSIKIIILGSYGGDFRFYYVSNGAMSIAGDNTDCDQMRQANMP